MNITIQTRATVASTILAALITRGTEGHTAVGKAVRLTEDLIEALERSPHGSFPDEPTPPPSRLVNERTA